jgi:Ca-activated chloride channel family protein
MTINRQSRTAYNSDAPAGLRALDGTVLPLTKVVAEGRLRNGLFEMSVEQHYRNAGRTNLETVYTFPLMPDAVLLGLELQMGERRLSGKALPVATARQDYEEALEDGNSAALLEKATDGLYTVSVGNLLAGETASIRYHYAQPICAKKGLLRITIPTTVAPRYGNPSSTLQPHQVPESDVVAEYPFTLTVQIDGEASSKTNSETRHEAITSPTHAIGLSTSSDSTRVSFPRACLDRDVVLLVQQTASPCIYIANTDAGCIAYAPIVATLPGLSEQLSPMSLRMVIDCSGSMAGESIKSARRGAMRVLEALTDADEVSITRFGTTFEHFDQRLTKAFPPEKRRALNYLQGTDATLGGTEMAAVLAAVSELAGAAAHSDVLLVTDGEIWAIDDLVALARRSEMRYFIVGVGFSPSHDNLLRLAQSTGGAYMAVTPGEDIEQAMEALLARIQQPRISATRLRWPLSCPWQTGLPLTLFRHESVAVFAGLGSMPEDDSVAVLQYHLGGSGDVLRIDESLEIKPWTGDPQLLLRVAVAMRIRELESSEATHSLLSVAEATRLAVEHNLVSCYTNYLVVLERDDSEKPIDLPDVVAIKQMAPPLSAVSEMSVRSVISDTKAMSDLSLPQFLRRQQVDETVVSRQHRVDVPLFSRRQLVDRPSSSVADTSVSFMQELMVDYSVDTLRENFALALNKRLGERNTGVVPSRIAVLVRLGLDDEIADALRQLVRDGANESEAVFALLLLMADLGQLADLSAANLDIVRKLSLRISAERLSELQSQLQSQLRDVVVQRA